MRFPFYLFVVACLSSVPNAWASNSGVIGTWRGPENSVIRIAPCGEELCAEVLSTGDETAAHLDSNNPDAALRTRPLCGLQIGQGFHGSDPNKAEGGHLYDPRTGKTYKGSMASQGDVLLLRGYIGVSMFGRTARWSRAQEPVEMCRNSPAATGVKAVPPAANTPAATVPNPAGAPSASPAAPAAKAPGTPSAAPAPPAAATPAAVPPVPSATPGPKAPNSPPQP